MLTIADLRRLESKIETLVSHVERREHPLEHILKELRIMSTQLDTLTAKVSKIEGVADSAIAAFNGIRQQLADAIAANKAGDDGAALDALSTGLDTKADALLAAITTSPAPVTAPTTPAAG